MLDTINPQSPAVTVPLHKEPYASEDAVFPDGDAFFVKNTDDQENGRSDFQYADHFIFAPPF